MEKKLTISGVRYTVRTRSWDNNLDISGPGSHMVGGVCISGIAIDDPGLRDRVIVEIAKAKERRKIASENLQASLEAEHKAN